MTGTEKQIPDWVEDLPEGQVQPWLVRDQGDFISIRQRDDGDPDTWHWVLIPEKEAATFLNTFNNALNPWVVVKHAGYERESIVCECRNYDDAWTAMQEQFPFEQEREELHVDIMKRLPNGDLTTEY